MSRPDLEPGFWNEYQMPSEISRAIEYPIHDARWPMRVVNAYLKDAEEDRRQRRQTPAPPSLLGD